MFRDLFGTFKVLELLTHKIKMFEQLKKNCQKQKNLQNIYTVYNNQVS